MGIGPIWGVALLPLYPLLVKNDYEIENEYVRLFSLVRRLCSVTLHIDQCRSYSFFLYY